MVSRSNLYGGVAQLVERALCMREARGSKPLISTNIFLIFIVTTAHHHHHNHVSHPKRRVLIEWDNEDGSNTIIVVI